MPALSNPPGSRPSRTPRRTIRATLAVLATTLVCVHTLADTANRPPAQDPLKTDILGVFAHPDDETGVAATLARYGRFEGRSIAHVYVTRGEGGGNMVGTQAGRALGILREGELRRCLEILGVRSCHFLEQEDFFYTESHAATLRKWNRAQALAALVRIIRTLRPEVIITMNPAPAPGQHGHHQAAGVLATEAFAAAADPSAFPEQIRDEGVSPWQCRKLFFGGTAGTILTVIPTTEPTTNGRSPAEIAGEALSHHRSQGFGSFANAPWLRRPQVFTLVKSVVPHGPDGHDLLAHLPATPPVAIQPFAQEPPVPPLAVVPRPSIQRYLDWTRAQGIRHLTADFPADLPVVAGETANLQLVVAPTAGVRRSADLLLGLPPTWRADAKPSILDPGTQGTIALKVQVPQDASDDAVLQVATADAPTNVLARAILHPVPRVRVPRMRSTAAAPAWNQGARIAIGTNQTWQGRAGSPDDCSAAAWLLHDDRGLHIAIEVRDDTVVSNIQPDDIRGHWRSDSIEICLDPAAGAEDTTGCFKLGVFPFDSAGKVRAARDADARQGPVERTAPGVRLASHRTAGGYRIEASIPWKDVVGDARPPRRLGFNLLVYDGDKADAAPGENINKTRLAWAPRSGIQGRPEDWGRIDLE